MLALLVGFVPTNAFAASRQVVYPSYSILVRQDAADKVHSTEFRIVEVNVTPECTALSCELTFLKKVKREELFISDGCNLYYQSAAGLTAIGLKEAAGIAIYDRTKKVSRKKYSHRRGETMKFTLYFDPLPDEVDNFDFIEDVFSGKNAVGISLSEGASSREQQKIGECPYEDIITEPTFLGAEKYSFSQWVNPRLVYPEILSDLGKEGRLIIEITIEEDGKTSYRVMEETLAPFNDEAMRVVLSAPMWSPAAFRGKPVRCHIKFPVIFQLR